MVFRHTEAPNSEFVLLFHMAIFFIASGYLYNTQRITDIKALGSYILKKIKSLWLPYFGFMTLFILLNNLFLRLNVYTDNPAYLSSYTSGKASLGQYFNVADMFKEIFKAAVFRGTAQVGGALWFLYTLFLLTIGYGILDFTIRRIIKKDNIVVGIQAVLSVAFLILGYIMYLVDKSFLGLNRFFSFYCLLFIGQMMRGRVVRIYEKMHPILIFLLTLIILIFLQPYGSIQLVNNRIENPIFFLIVSIIGWLMMYSLAVFFKQINFAGNRAIAYLSIHAIPIIGLHFLAFKLVNWLAVEINGMEHYMIAGFPVLMHGMWWIAYMITGIAVPLVIDKILRKMKSSVTFHAK